MYLPSLSIAARMSDLVKCPMCDKVYASTQARAKHIRSKHDVQSRTNQQLSSISIRSAFSDNYRCCYCQENFKGSKSRLRKHIFMAHREPLGLQRQKRKVICAQPTCQTSFPSYQMYHRHLKEEHNVELEEEHLLFECKSDFEDWKSKSTPEAHYVKECGTRRLKGRRVDYFRCHRSYSPNITSGKRTKYKGSVKLGKACPSNMRVEFSTEKVFVHFIKTHFGHTCDIGSIPIPLADKIQIAEKLAAGVPGQALLKDIHDSISNSQLERESALDLVRTKDLHSVGVQFKIKTHGVQNPAKKLQQLQRLQAEQVGGSVTFTLQQTGGGGGSQHVLLTAPQGFITASGAQQPAAEHILHASSQQIGTTSIQHVLQSSISHHVRQASILQSSLHQIPAAQVGGAELRATLDKGAGSTPSSPFSPRSLTPSPSPNAQHRTVVTPQPQVVVSNHQAQAHPTVLQFIQHQATTRNTGTIGTLMPSQVIKTKPPPQILPKPASGASPHASSASSPSAPKMASQPTLQQTQTIAQPQGALLLNQMLPNGAVLVQQQTSSGVQFILKTPHHQQQKTGLVLANGSLHQPQHVIVQGRTQAHQVLRLVPGQMQLQQIQTSSGPTFIAVPTAQAAPAPRSTPSPQAAPTIAFTHKKLKKKKKREDEPPTPPTHHRLDLANLIKISGIEDDDVISSTPAASASSTGCQATATPLKVASPPPAPIPKPVPQLHHNTHHHAHQMPTKQFNPSQLLAQLQSPAQVGGGLRLSVSEDGSMVVTQADQAAGVTPSIAAAAQSQLAQLIADHGGQILQTNTSLSNNTSKETAFMQSLQTAVLQFQGASTDGMVLKGIPNQAGSVVVNAAGTATSNIRRTPVVMAPSIQQNGVRLVADLNGTLQQASSSLTEHNRLIVSSLAPAVLEQNRVQIVTGVPTSSALSLEQQQNRLIMSAGTPNAMLTQQGRVQIVTSNSSAVSLTEQNRVIVSNVPNNVSLDQNRLHFMSTGLQNSLMGEQNRVIVSGVQGNMSLSEQNRVQIVAGGQSSGMALEQNRVIMSGMQSSLTEQQNRVQFVSGVPNSGNTLSLSEQNRVHIVSNMPNSNILSEKQNLVQVVNSNICLSEEQNRVQIVTSVANQIPEQSRLHIVNSIPSSNTISLSEQNRVQLVTNVPVSNSFTISDNVQLVTSLPNSVAEQNKIHFSSMTHSNSLNVPNHQNQQVHMVTSMPNSSDNKVQVVTSLPSPSPVFSPADQHHQHQQQQQLQNKVHFAFKNHSTTPLDQKRNVINYHNDHSNVQVVSALVNSDKEKFPQQQFVKPSELRVISGCLNKDKELRIEEREDGSKVLSGLDQAICSGGGVGSLSDVAPPRVQYVTNAHDDSRVQVVGANNHHTSVISQGNQVRTSVVYSHDSSPKMAKSPGSGGFTSPINSPPPVAASSPAPAPTAFNNRPNLTVVTGPTRPVENKQDPNSMVVVSTSSKTAQTNTPRVRSYDNAFLDSIAQAHPSLVINKSSPPQASKIIKGKKPIKKAALVKPMMAEDRSTVVDKDDPPNLVPINSNDTINAPPLPSAPVVSRVQTIQLTPQKQQQLKAIQAQVASLTANKFRSPAEQATLQRLVSEQRKILLGGKVVPTVPGQHAQGVAFVSANSGLPSVGAAASQVRHHSTSVTQPAQQSRGVVTSVEQQVQTPITMSSPLAPTHSAAHPPTSAMSVKCQQQVHQQQQHPPHPAPHPVLQPAPLPQPQPTTHAHKATSPIPTQHQVSTQTPQLPPPPPPPIFTKAKRAQLIDQQFQADRQGALAPDTHTPFTCKADAVKRLIRYHTLNEPVLSEKDLNKADEIFEQTARTLLDRKAHMYNKFAYLLLKESMRMEQTSELVLLNRFAIDEETSKNEQLAHAAQAAAQAAAAPSAGTSTDSHSSSSPSCSTEHGLKRDRDDSDGPDAKKHCPDDEEINAQVQSAIDSILNLQRKPPP